VGRGTSSSSVRPAAGASSRHRDRHGCRSEAGRRRRPARCRGYALLPAQSDSDGRVARPPMVDPMSSTIFGPVFSVGASSHPCLRLDSTGCAFTLLSALATPALGPVGGRRQGSQPRSGPLTPDTSRLCWAGTTYELSTVRRYSSTGRQLARA
jgi:hypothetical protein